MADRDGTGRACATTVDPAARGHAALHASCVQGPGSTERTGAAWIARGLAAPVRRRRLADSALALPILFLPILALPILAACSPRALAPSPNDRLREALATRTAERDAARARASELETRLAALEASAPVDPEVAAATPRLAGVEVSGMSTARLLAGEGPAATGTVALVLVPRDGLGRFLQVAGRLEATFALLVPGEAPIAGGTVRLSPGELRDRYRAGFLGEHYTIEVPIEWESARSPRAVAVSAEFVDGASGRRFPITTTLPLAPAAARPAGSATDGDSR